MKSSGRKIRRSTGLYGNKRKNKFRGRIALIVTFIIACGLIFLGYSVAEPVMEFYEKWRSNGDKFSSEQPWTPNISSSETPNDGDVEDKSNSETKESKPEKPTDNPGGAAESTLDNYTALELNGAQIQNETNLVESIDNAKLNGYTAVVVSLKEQGGRIYYSSKVQSAIESGAVSSQLPVERISQLIKERGLVAVAKVDTLYDNIFPTYDKMGAYLFSGGETAWYDNAVNSGGKMWVSPFSETGKAYVSDIAKEVCAAGFDEVVASNVIFPSFRQTDLNYIGQIVKNADRYKILFPIIDVYRESCMLKGTKFSIEVEAKSVILGSSEAFKPSERPDVNYIVAFNNNIMGKTIVLDDQEVLLTQLSIYDKVKLTYEMVIKKAEGANITPCIMRDGLNPGDISDAIKAVVDLGYKAYIITSG